MMDEVADIPYEGVVGWLLCRRLLPEDYHQRLKGMTAHVQAALQQPLGTPEATALIDERKGSPFGYNEVNKLVQILAKEGGADGLFSKAFGSAAYRQWRRLQRTFQQQNLHLADISRAVCRAANALVPSHQRNLQQKRRLVLECIKKQQQLQQASTAAQESYRQLCVKYGLDAAVATDPLLLQQQLRVYVHRKLPVRLQRVELLLQQDGSQLLSFYRSFVAYSIGKPPQQRQEKLLPLLCLISVKGNISLKEAATAAADIPVLQQQLQHLQHQQQEAAAAQIVIQQQGEEEGSGEPEGPPPDETISWIVEEGVEDPNNRSNSDSSSSSSLTESLLCNGAVRRELLLELTELRAFVYSRISQSDATKSNGSRKQQQQQQWKQNTFLPQELQKDERTLLGWRQSIEELHELLGGAETHQLLQLLQSDTAFNRVLNELLAARALVQKPLSAAKQQQARQATLESEVASAAATLEKQRRDLQQLLRLLQETINTAVGRKVRITGISRDRLP